MKFRLYLFLFLLGSVVSVLIAAFQPAPGYMDADYYYAGGIQLFKGNGFSEPYLWNYLDDPVGLPHSSHAYWMPLASLIAAAGMALTGTASWSAARIGFILVAAFIPPINAALAWSFSGKRDVAVLAGLLGAFPAFYLPFLADSDTFGLCILLGGLFFLILKRRSSLLNPFLLGVLAGFMHLARTDGFIWLLIAWLAVLYVLPQPLGRRPLFISSSMILTLAGYLVVMAPWFIRNQLAFGTPLAPGGSKLFWLTSYDQLFSYPASQISFSAWWQSGLGSILRDRAWALTLNLSNFLSVQGEVFLLPLVCVGFWHLRKDRRLQLAGFSWVILLLVMTFIFPFAGARGGFFHSGASVQAVWWALAPVGLDQVIQWGNRKRGWNLVQASRIFRYALVGFAILMTAAIVLWRVLGVGGSPNWGQEEALYRQIHSFLQEKGMNDEVVVMVANPPGFFLSSGNPAIAVPDGDKETLISVAHRYEAKYLILEEGSTPQTLHSVYVSPADQTGLSYLGDIDGSHIYAIQP
jgi:hypothetical protein